MTAAQPEIDHVPTEEVAPARRKGPMDQVIETLASGLGNSVGWLAEHGVLFVIFVLIWVAFGAGLLLSQGSLDQAWQAIRGLPLIVQVLVWLLFLPVMIGLWVWETTWPLILRLVLVVGIAGWNLLIFLPKAFQAARP
jgi:ABC-type amino acid transport system permease subunit